MIELQKSNNVLGEKKIPNVIKNLKLKLKKLIQIKIKEKIKIMPIKINQMKNQMRNQLKKKKKIIIPKMNLTKK